MPVPLRRCRGCLGLLRYAAETARASGDAMTIGEAALVIRDLTNDPICGRIHLLCREALSLLAEDQLAVTANPMAGGPEPGLSDRALAAAERTGDTDARFLALQARHADRTDFRCSAERPEIGTLAVTLGREGGRQGYAAWDHLCRPSWRSRPWSSGSPAAGGRASAAVPAPQSAS